MRRGAETFEIMHKSHADHTKKFDKKVLYPRLTARVFSIYIVNIVRIGGVRAYE